jgi:transketolase
MIGRLENIAKKIRIETLKSITAAKSGHTGGSLGLADIFAVLYFHQLKHSPKSPNWEERDRLVLSIGHVAPVLYSSLALAGYFPVDELKSLRKLGSRLQGHPGRNHGLPGLELSAGSLGQGLSVAVGMALAAKHQNQDHNIYCITGDGELQEGSIWEAAMSAGHYHLDNLITLVDRNGVQIDGSTEDVMSLEPLDKKWEAFGWKVFHCNGNDIPEIIDTYNKAVNFSGKPKVIIAKTKMGKGISEIEGDYKWHGKAPNNEELEIFLKELL